MGQREAGCCGWFGWVRGAGRCCLAGPGPFLLSHTLSLSLSLSLSRSLALFSLSLSSLSLSLSLLSQVLLADLAGLVSARARLAEGGLADSMYRLAAAAADEPVCVCARARVWLCTSE